MEVYFRQGKIIHGVYELVALVTPEFGAKSYTNKARYCSAVA